MPGGIRSALWRLLGGAARRRRFDPGEPPHWPDGVGYVLAVRPVDLAVAAEIITAVTAAGPAGSFQPRDLADPEVIPVVHRSEVVGLAGLAWVGWKFVAAGLGWAAWRARGRAVRLERQ